MQNGKWKLQGYDTFANEYYPLDGEFGPVPLACG